MRFQSEMVLVVAGMAFGSIWGELKPGEWQVHDARDAARIIKFPALRILSTPEIERILNDLALLHEKSAARKYIEELAVKPLS